MSNPEQQNVLEMYQFLQSRKRTVITEAQLHSRNAQLASEIKQHYFPNKENTDHSNLILLCVLKGGAPFTTALHQELFRLGVDVPLEYLPASSYEDGKVTSGKVKFTLSDKLIHHLSGKDVIIVDDVIDTGLTLSLLKAEIQTKANPKSIKIAAEIDKRSRRKVELDGEFIGFSLPDYWLEGFGMDTADLGRGNPEIVRVLSDAEYLMQMQILQNMLSDLLSEEELLPSA